jgi:structural maintenance of chromosome 3 (chondroitin sulfate proteoglycan 6)
MFLTCAYSQQLEEELTAHRQRLRILVLSKQGSDSEMHDLVRSRTEVECAIDDMRQSGERTGEQKTSLERALRNVQKRITALEAELMELTPAWQDRVKEEQEEKRRSGLLSSRFCLFYLSSSPLQTRGSPRPTSNLIRKARTNLAIHNQSRTRCVLEEGNSKHQVVRGETGQDAGGIDCRCRCCPYSTRWSGTKGRERSPTLRGS